MIVNKGSFWQVRLWKIARTPVEILSHMRDGSSLSNHKDLLAYWRFDDPDQSVLPFLCLQSASQIHLHLRTCFLSIKLSISLVKVNNTGMAAFTETIWWPKIVAATAMTCHS